MKYFSKFDYVKALKFPLIFSSYLSNTYKDTDMEELRDYLIEKLR